MKKILVPIDDSECSNMAIEKAGELAKIYDSEIILLYVDEAEGENSVVAASQAHIGQIPMGGASAPLAFGTNTTSKEQSDSEEKILTSAKSKLMVLGDRVTTILMYGNPANVIIKYAKQSDIDLVVMGSSSKSGLKRFFMGSVAEKVAKSINQSILIVR